MTRTTARRGEENRGLAIFVSEREVVFFFEGDSATAAVDALSKSPRMLKAAVRSRGILAGRPRLAEERFGWTRTS